ncbi:unnamed protein product [Bursaphelenchus xylophilus]|uniref:(pine wood nematode) hypothetical protein n=1 Tax=Bursaphelenchus xylophilus TaxID=6326 RepID=A0A1I7S249_BURXY|nr:unnamed protein product [Bursaphelenchus xylophilus]CAG9114913.1 unnamed protein product [Bursaphelenchus xylophilus]
MAPLEVLSKDDHPKITHVIFDMDGTLVESEAMYSQMHRKALAKYGKELSPEMKAATQGRPIPDEIRILIEMAGLEGIVSEEEMYKQYIELYEEHLSNVKPLPGTDRLIRHLHKNKVPIAICTSSAADEFEIKTRNLKEWMELIPTRILAGSDPRIKNGKPNPDPYLQCAKDLGANPATCLVFEDSVNGCKSALSAGMHCIMIPQWEFQCDASKAAVEKLKPQLDEILKSMEEFKPEKYGLPPFE